MNILAFPIKVNKMGLLIGRYVVRDFLWLFIFIADRLTLHFQILDFNIYV